MDQTIITLSKTKQLAHVKNIVWSMKETKSFPRSLAFDIGNKLSSPLRLLA